MSRYRLQWLPQGAIPADLDLKVTLDPLPEAVTATIGGACVATFVAYAVTGAAVYNVVESTTVQTWNFPCTGSPWSIVILGFAIGCGGAFTWRHDIDNGATLADHVTFTEDVDPVFGGPVLRIDGDGADGCVDSGATITINLKLDGDASFSTSIQLRPSPPALQLNFDSGFFIGGTDEWSYFGTGDGINGGGLAVTMPPSGNDAEYQFTFSIPGAAGSVSWSVDTSGSDPGFTIFSFNGVNTITFDISRTGGANGLSINFYATDDLTGNLIPIGAPGTQFNIVG